MAASIYLSEHIIPHGMVCCIQVFLLSCGELGILYTVSVLLEYIDLTISPWGKGKGVLYAQLQYTVIVPFSLIIIACIIHQVLRKINHSNQKKNDDSKV